MHEDEQEQFWIILLLADISSHTHRDTDILVRIMHRKDGSLRYEQDENCYLTPCRVVNLARSSIWLHMFRFGLSSLLYLKISWETQWQQAPNRELSAATATYLVEEKTSSFVTDQIDNTRTTAIISSISPACWWRWKDTLTSIEARSSAKCSETDFRTRRAREDDRLRLEQQISARQAEITFLDENQGGLEDYLVSLKAKSLSVAL